MKKKLLTLAVAAALPMAAQAANAEVTIYGKLHASIDYVDYDANNTTIGAGGAPYDRDSQWDVTSRASRLGFKGSEDLGNGLKFIWKVETQMSITDGGTFGFRNTYVGLAGGWGTFLYGRHDTPVKMSTGKLDIFADTIADYNIGSQTGGFGGFIDIRANDAIAYVSPNFSGLTLIGAIVPDADANAAGTGDGSGDLAGGYSLAAMYSNGGLFIAGGYENVDNLADETFDADLSHWRIGAGYDFNNFHIGGVYQQADGAFAGFVDASGNFIDFKTYTINGSYKFGNNVVKAMWLRTDWDDDITILDGAGTDTTDSTDSWAIGLDHNFSKRSKVYVIYADSDINLHTTNFGLQGQKGISMGMVHSF